MKREEVELLFMDSNQERGSWNKKFTKEDLKQQVQGVNDSMITLKIIFFLSKINSKIIWKMVWKFCVLQRYTVKNIVLHKINVLTNSSVFSPPSVSILKICLRGILLYILQFWTHHLHPLISAAFSLPWNKSVTLN